MSDDSENTEIPVAAAEIAAEVPEESTAAAAETEESEARETSKEDEDEDKQVPDAGEEEEEEEEDADFDEEGDGEDEILDFDSLSKLKARKRSNAPKAPAPAPSSTARAKSTEPDNRDEEAVVADESAKRRQELEAKLERALKRPKIKRRKDEHDLTNDEDEIIQILKQQMDTAAKQDAELIDNQSGIAINKVQLLPRVRDVLSKANLAEVILDNNLLAEVRQWLEPLPDGSLPSYEIQKTMFSSLLKLPINTNHLRESGIGKILLFYQKSKRVEPRIKRIADKLISDWTRPIIGASDNYRDKRFHSVDFDATKLRRKQDKPRTMTTAEKKQREAEKSIYEQQAARRNRAAAPAPTVTDYKFAPKARVDDRAMSIASAGVGSSLNNDDQFKRIKSKLTGKRAGGSKKGGISIEGRNL